MRRAHDNGFLLDQHGRTIGVNLGADHCAEHEWGIESIRRTFGMKDEADGVDRRCIRKTSPLLRWYHDKHQEGRKTVPYEGIWLMYWEKAEGPSERPYPTQESPFATGWSERDFGAFSTDPKQVKRLREIYESFESLNTLIWLGGGGVFQNAGLVIAIRDRMDQKHLDAWLQADLETKQLKKDAAATGIEERLRKSGKRWYALSPSRWADGTIRFFLNPCDQHLNNSGWFTVDSLDAWIIGKGPIPKTPEQRRRDR